MRKLGMLILCGACWLAGYYCGQRTDSPDIFGWMSTQVQKLDRLRQPGQRGSARCRQAARAQTADRNGIEGSDTTAAAR